MKLTIKRLENVLPFIFCYFSNGQYVEILWFLTFYQTQTFNLTPWKSMIEMDFIK